MKYQALCLMALVACTVCSTAQATRIEVLTTVKVAAQPPAPKGYVRVNTAEQGDWLCPKDTLLVRPSGEVLVNLMACTATPKPE